MLLTGNFWKQQSSVGFVSISKGQGVFGVRANGFGFIASYERGTYYVVTNGTAPGFWVGFKSRYSSYRAAGLLLHFEM